MIKFHDKVYALSRELSKETMRNEFSNIIKNIQIFSIKLRRLSKFYHSQSSHSHLPKIYDHIEKYVELMLQHNETFFKDRSIIATLDNNKKCHILIHGKRGRYLMESKALVRNIL